MAAQLSAGRKVAIVVLIVLVGVLLGVAFNMKSIIQRFEGARNEAFYTSMHESCLSSATQSAQANGADVTALKPKIEAYCDCAVQEARSRIPPEQAESLDLTSPAGQSKLAEVAQACAGKLSQ